MKTLRWLTGCSLLALTLAAPAAAEDWLQYGYDAQHSGNVPDRDVQTPLGLVGAVPLTDGIYTAPVVAGGRVYVVDGSGVTFCLDAATLKVVWKVATRGGKDNCNNVSSPAVAGRYLHFGTTAGYYYVLDRDSGAVVREIDCRDPIFSTPVVGKDRVYFVTLGSQVYAVEPDGSPAWSWDFVKEVIGFEGNRWSGEEWHRHKKGRVDWRDHFCCSRNLALHDQTVVVPAGGRVVFLEDEGAKPRVRRVAEIPKQNGSEYPAAFGLSLGEDGAAYVQWHRRDNVGRVEILRLGADDKLEASSVPGTLTAIDLPGLLSFAAVSVRGDDVYRVRPETGLALCRHKPGQETPENLGGPPSICQPIVVKNSVVVGGLDGALHVVPLNGEGKAWSYQTPFGAPITAPPAVANGRVYFGGEDGYLYVLGPNGNAAPPTRELNLHAIRSPLSGSRTDAKYDWYTNYGDMGCTNAKSQNIRWWPTRASKVWRDRRATRVVTRRGRSTRPPWLASAAATRHRL